MAFCLLCGVPYNSKKSFRDADVSTVQTVVRQRCVPSNFHHASLMALPPGGRAVMCWQCVTWTRRARKFLRERRRYGRGSQRVPTPLDSVLLHTIAPGFFPEPDRRCFERLAAAAIDGCNGFASVVPCELLEILRDVLAKSPPTPDVLRAEHVRSWWTANEETAFFRHAETARVVRHTCVFSDPTQSAGRKRWRK